MIFFKVFWIFFWNGNKTIMVEDTLSLIAHSLMEIQFYISFISSTFLIRLTVYEILSVFWKMAFKNCKPHVLRNYYGDVDTLTNNFVTSVFIKWYRRIC